MASGRILSHFSVFAFEPTFWDLAAGARVHRERQLRSALGRAADSVHFYHTFGIRHSSEALVWCCLRAEAADAPARFFERFAEFLSPFRNHVRLVDTLWGFTGESEYTRGASQRAIDALQPRTRQYLIVYPFAKTHAWYMAPSEMRQRMMSEHIRVGRSNSGVEQQILYCAGLQDHEFVVVYETDDLASFTALVAELRRTEARGYTARDVPVHVGVRVCTEDG